MSERLQLALASTAQATAQAAARVQRAEFDAQGGWLRAATLERQLAMVRKQLAGAHRQQHKPQKQAIQHGGVHATEGVPLGPAWRLPDYERFR